MLAPNTILQNRYQVLRSLGVGGMGAVYQANDLRLNQIVALKENSGGDPRQFQQEASLLANLRHPNLPRVIDHFVESNAQYLVMDYIEGEDVQAQIDRAGALSEAQVLAWFNQILDAVAYLHNRGIIHRDIKPANIKITPQGQAVLVDFGIAKVYRPGQLTASGARAVTMGFSAPEQYGSGTDQRSDIYSLGATLYVLLTGHAPPDALARAGGSAMLVPPRQLNPALSYPVEQAILCALAVPPDQRWQTVAELRAALKSLVAPTQMASPQLMPTMPLMPPGQLVTKPSRTTAPFVLAVIGIIIVGTMLIVIVFGAVVLPLLAQHPTTSPTGFPTETSTATKFAVAVPLTPPIAPLSPGPTATLVIALPTMATSTPGASVIPGAGTPCSSDPHRATYTAQQGDWFYQVARKFGLSVAQLQAANPGVNPNFLYPGQVLNIPGPGCIAPDATPTPSGSTTPTPGASGMTYTVQPGDTLYAIAVRSHTTTYALQIANHLPNANATYPGMVLIIPTPDATLTMPSVTPMP